MPEIFCTFKLQKNEETKEEIKEALSNLHLINSGFNIPVKDVDIIRCCNVFNGLSKEYYREEKYMPAIYQMGESLREGGILIIGGAIPTLGIIFKVYQRVNSEMVLREIVSFNEGVFNENEHDFFDSIHTPFFLEQGPKEVYKDIRKVCGILKKDSLVRVMKPREATRRLVNAINQMYTGKYKASFIEDKGFIILKLHEAEQNMLAQRIKEMFDGNKIIADDGQPYALSAKIYDNWVEISLQAIDVKLAPLAGFSLEADTIEFAYINLQIQDYSNNQDLSLSIP